MRESHTRWMDYGVWGMRYSIWIYSMTWCLINKFTDKIKRSDHFGTTQEKWEDLFLRQAKMGLPSHWANNTGGAVWSKSTPFKGFSPSRCFTTCSLNLCVLFALCCLLSAAAEVLEISISISIRTHQHQHRHQLFSTSPVLVLSRVNKSG
jgi:hypothetical protein